MKHLVVLILLVSGSGNVWTDGTLTWAGNPFCLEFGLLKKPSAAIDAGVLTENHCPVAGMNPSGCVEWFGAAPDLGACELIPVAPKAPVNMRIE